MVAEGLHASEASSNVQTAWCCSNDTGGERAVTAVQALVNIRLKANFADGKAAAGIEIVIPLPKEVMPCLSQPCCNHN